MQTYLNKSARNAGLALILLGSLAVAPGWAATGGGHHDGDPARMLKKMSAHLELSESQQSEVAKLLERAREAGAADRERMQELRQQLRAQQSSFEAGTAQALADELGQITARSSYRRVETKAAIHRLLDDSQREKLEQMEAKRHQHRLKRGHEGGRHIDRKE